ncbi:MAG: transglutaminase-like domain-containing protein [Myxococcota bacterium]
MDPHLAETRLLDLRAPSLRALVAERGWRRLPAFDAIGAIHGFVRDEVRFGYNASDELPASRVLRDGYGQCNTKGTLLMALLRAVGLPCRFHGFTIDKALQRGAITGLAYRLAPRSIVHSWVEVLHDGRWVELEGFILDRAYLDGVRSLFPDARGAFCGYGIATRDIEKLENEWRGRGTYIQSTGIDHDYGVFESPDAFYAQHGSNLSGLRRLLYAGLVRHAMNANVRRIRRLGGGARAPLLRSRRLRAC